MSNEHLLAVDLPWTPKVKTRPRMTKTGHTYNEPATVKAEKDLADQFERLVTTGSRFDFPIEMMAQFSNDHVFLNFWRADDYVNRKLRGDVDNYLKLVSDALNGVAYTDDRLIIKVTGEKL